MSKKKTEKKEPIDKSNHIEMHDQTGKSRDRLITELATSGLCTNAGLIVNFSKDNLGELSLTDCIETLKDKGRSINSGNMNDLETMLTSQAVALDVIFSSMAMRARTNMGHYPDTVNKYMNLALRAQSQCRATVEALAEIKNPKPYIQNNKAQYQQVNNGAPHARAGENSKSANRLLEDQSNDGQWMDTGAPETAGGNDKELEAVGVIDRPQNP